MWTCFTIAFEFIRYEQIKFKSQSSNPVQQSSPLSSPVQWLANAQPFTMTTGIPSHKVLIFMNSYHNNANDTVIINDVELDKVKSFQFQIAICNIVVKIVFVTSIPCHFQDHRPGHQ